QISAATAAVAKSAQDTAQRQDFTWTATAAPFLLDVYTGLRTLGRLCGDEQCRDWVEDRFWQAKEPCLHCGCPASIGLPPTDLGRRGRVAEGNGLLNRHTL